MNICQILCLQLHHRYKILLALKVQYQTHKVLAEGVVTKIVVAALENYANLMSH